MSGNLSSAEATATVEAQLDRVERDLSLLHQQVARLQRLASLGTVTASLAHEYNNLLTPLVSYTELAMRRGDPDSMRKAVEKTHAQLGQLRSLCRRILGMATPSEMGPSNLDVADLFDEAIACLGRPLERDGIEMTIDVPHGLMVRANAGSLQQVLFNLVLNARQAIAGRAGGRLRLAGRADESVGLVTLTVSDNGPGIEPENVSRVFEPFFSTKSDSDGAGGLGLGLHICRRLMNEQNGTIDVESVLGAGATFRLTLPGPTAD